MLDVFMKSIHEGFDTEKEIEPNMYAELLRLMNEATIEGLSMSNFSIEHNREFLHAIKHSNEVFSAFKTHAMGRSMQAKLLDEKGRLKSYDRWAKEVRFISSHHVGAWLRTEYNTAVLRAHNAGDWREFMANKDIMPNLRWVPTTSPDAEATHRSFWEKKLTLPIEHPFWNKHHPGDRWNCKCALEATDEPASDENIIKDIPDIAPQRGLENNPGKDGVIINDNHPYFPRNCSLCAFYKQRGVKDRIKEWFKNHKKDCCKCEFIDGRLPQEISDFIKERRRNYEKLLYSDDYIDVQFNEKNGGLKATNKEHNIDKNKGWYESTVQQIGFKNGHKVILEKEIHSVLNKKNTEGTWNDTLFEIAGAETATSNNIRNALKHCASKPNAEVAVIFFPNDNFNIDNFNEGYRKYKGLKGSSQYKQFKEIYCIDKENIILQKSQVKKLGKNEGRVLKD